MTIWRMIVGAIGSYGYRTPVSDKPCFFVWEECLGENKGRYCR
jgi:hypothetical protein